MRRQRPVLRQQPGTPEIINLASDSDSELEEPKFSMLPAAGGGVAPTSAPEPAAARTEPAHAKADDKPDEVKGDKLETKVDNMPEVITDLVGESDPEEAFSLLDAADRELALNADEKVDIKSKDKVNCGGHNPAVAAEPPCTSGVFRLYQDGMAPDQVLQLCYIRRRAPRSARCERIRIEDELVIPRPALQIADVLPPLDIPLQRLVAGESTSSSAGSASNTATASSRSNRTVRQARESAQKHFLSPHEADPGDVRLWSVLSDWDWTQVYQRVQKSERQENQPLPSLPDMCWMLKECGSDALANFVWEQLLIPLLQREHLLAALVRQQTFASLAPKEFRAKVRVRNLRQVDETVGAQLELALVALFQRQRETRKP